MLSNRIDAESNIQKVYGSHLLVVDDDSRLRKLIKRHFIKRGYLVTTCESAEIAREALHYFTFDAIVLDINLGGESGLSLGKEISQRKLAGILYLSARSTPDDRVEGLEAGGADYLTKPFDPRELELRLNNLIQSHSNIANEVIFGTKIGDLFYDIDKGELTHSTKGKILLTRVEKNTMHVLAQACPSSATRAQLSEALGGASDRALATIISRLRKKIEAENSSQDDPLIITLRGEGYLLRGEPTY